MTGPDGQGDAGRALTSACRHGYEQGAYRIGPAVDRLLRLMVAVLYVRDQDLASAVVSNPVAGKAAEPLKLTLRIDQHGEYRVVGGSPSGRHQAAS